MYTLGPARVRLVESRLTGIERARKAVVLPDDSILPYDYLVVAPELGDQTLVPLGADASEVPRLQWVAHE